MTFILKNKDRARSQIVLLVNFKGKKYEKSIGESIQGKYWNAAKKRVRVVSEYPEGEDVNDILDKWDEAAKEAVKHFKSYIDPPQPRAFFDKLDDFFYKDKRGIEDVPLLTDYMDIFISRHSSGKSVSCIKKYTTTRNKVVAYERVRKKRLKFEDINMDFYADFKSWFFGNGWSINYFGNMIKTLKQMLEEAKYEDELHNNNKYLNRAFVGAREDVDSVYLTESEVQSIYDLEITPEIIKSFYFKEGVKLDRRQAEQRSEAYNHIRDWFLIGAYTGFRVSDFCRLNNSHVKDFIRLRSKKTNTVSVIPIKRNLKVILDRIDFNSPPTPKAINEHIKEIARMTNIKDEIAITHSRGGVHQEEFIKKYNLITCHTARRSFATNAYKAGLSLYDIMRFLGHSKIQTTIKYLKLENEETAESLSGHAFFQ